MDLDNIIRKYALQNAVRYKGKANPGNVVPKVLGEDPTLKAKMKELMPLINKIVIEVNAIDAEKQKEILMQIAPELLEKKEHAPRDELKSLESVDERSGVIMRFAPSPSGPMHIGHAITGGLTSLYVKKYGGKFILRIEDTNSDNIDTDAYSLLPKDAEWIFGNVSEVWIQSDRMEIYYSYSRKLLELGSAYICSCSQEDFKKCVDAMQDCPCRGKSPSENLERWEMMFDKQNGYKEGDVVMRFKSGMQDNNPAMRDFPLARINDSVHPRQGTKYRVWPLMNLAVTVDDIEAKMTHIIRAKDHMDNAKRQERIYRALGLAETYPKTYFTGRYNFEGLEISCSKTKAKIKEGKFWGWDDIRVPFLQALKRRGYQPETFLRYARMNGLSQTDKTVSAEEFFKIIDAFNSELIDPQARRLFFVYDYDIITVIDAPEQQIILKSHPDNNSLGERHLRTRDSFLVMKSDIKEFKDGEICRLMDCLNFRKTGNNFVFESLDYDDFKEKGHKIVHFLPADSHYDAEILMPDATTLKGKIELSVDLLKEGDIVQLERFGFCRLDTVIGEGNQRTFRFWFAHK